MNKSNEWFIDSAATKHMTNNKSILENYVQSQEPRNNYLRDSTVILAHGKGKFKLPTVNSTREIVLDLHQVLFVQKLTKNLLSVPAMALMGAEINFDKDKCLVRKNGQESVIGSLLGDKLYIVNSTDYAQVSTANSAASLAVWHRRLGHLNYTYMNQLMKKVMVDGLNYDADTQSQKECEACVLGKMQKEPFPLNRANIGQPDHTRLYTVMYVAQCKWNQKAAVNICSHSQMNFHYIPLLTSLNPRLKCF